MEVVTRVIPIATVIPEHVIVHATHAPRNNGSKR